MKDKGVDVPTEGLAALVPLPVRRHVIAELQLDFGDEDAAAGHEGFDKQAAALKELL